MQIPNSNKLILDDQGNHLDSYNQFGIIQVLQRAPILQTLNWSGTFFAVSYNKPALVPRQLGTAPIYQRYQITLLLHTKISYFQGQVNATQKSHTHNVPVTNLNYGQGFLCAVLLLDSNYRRLNFQWSVHTGIIIMRSS